jgi:hypothetical protein
MVAEQAGQVAQTGLDSGPAPERLDGAPRTLLRVDSKAEQAGMCCPDWFGRRTALEWQLNRPDVLYRLV